MSCIRTACLEQGFDLDVLAAHMGAPEMLLRKMDEEAERLPEELARIIEGISREREERMVEGFIANLSQGVKELSENKSPLVFVVYDSMSDFRGGGKDLEGLTPALHRRVIARLGVRLAEQGISVVGVPFDRASFDAWRGDAEDSPVARAMWGAAHVSRNNK